MIEPLDQQVRGADPDRWLSSRFAAQDKRGGLIGLYALDLELSRIAAQVSQPLLGEMRLAWWREEVEAQRTSHPALAALVESGALGVMRPFVERLIEAHHADLDPDPFADEAALMHWLDETCGSVMAAAAAWLAHTVEERATRNTARAWGLATLSPDRWPATWREADPVEAARHLRSQTLGALEAARTELAALPDTAFPALAHATLVPGYARGLALTPLGKRARLLWAVIRGRL